MINHKKRLGIPSTQTHELKLNLQLKVRKEVQWLLQKKTPQIGRQIPLEMGTGGGGGGGKKGGNGGKRPPEDKFEIEGSPK